MDSPKHKQAICELLTMMGEPETNFQKYFSTPKKAAQFMLHINQHDPGALYCHWQCENFEDCPHEEKCIVDWLNEPASENDEA